MTQSINPSALNSLAAAGLDANNVSGLSPDSILVFCQTRLNDLNDRIQGYMDRQTKMQELQSAIGKLQSLLPGNTTSDGNYKYDYADVKAAYDNVIELANETGVKVDLGRVDHLCVADDRPGSDGATDEILNENESSEIKACLNAASSDVSKGLELDMIQLQSLVQQRQTAIQLSTNLMSTINEGPKCIAQNMHV